MKKFVLLFLSVCFIVLGMVACSDEPVQYDCNTNGHKWEASKTVEATCIENGLKEYTCSVCKETKEEIIPMIPHNLDEANQCVACKRIIYDSLAEFNEKATLDNTKDKVVEITLGELDFVDINYSESNSGYTGKGLLIGNKSLNHYGATPAEKGQYKFIFKNGTINSSTKAYKNIDYIQNTSIFMLLPGNSDVNFEKVTFNNIISFGIQPYTSPWSYMDTLTIEECVFNGIVTGTSPAENIIFNRCTFNNYLNKYQATDESDTFNYENNSNSIWLRSRMDSYSGDYKSNPVSMKKVTFTNNIVNSSRPVKFERIGQNCEALGYTAELIILDNTFDMSFANSADVEGEDKHMALYLGQTDTKSNFILHDDGNVVNDGIALYTTQNPYYEVPGTQILDRNGNPKEIEAKVWKSADDFFTMKSIPEVN